MKSSGAVGERFLTDVPPGQQTVVHRSWLPSADPGIAVRRQQAAAAGGGGGGGRRHEGLAELLGGEHAVEVRLARDTHEERIGGVAVAVRVVVVVLEEEDESSRAFFSDGEDIEARNAFPPFFTFFFPR